MLLIVFGVFNVLISKSILRQNNVDFFIPISLRQKKKEVHTLLAGCMDFLRYTLSLCVTKGITKKSSKYK